MGMQLVVINVMQLPRRRHLGNVYENSIWDIKNMVFIGSLVSIIDGEDM